MTTINTQLIRAAGLVLAVSLALAGPLSAKKIYVGGGGPGSEWGILKTKVTPQYASVLVDGEFVGHTDEFNQPGQGIYVKPGTHRVTISHVYFNDHTEEITVAAGETKTIRQSLSASNEKRPKRPYAKVKFPCKKTCRASVKVNGRYVGHVDEMNGPFQRMADPEGNEFSFVSG